MIILIIIPIIAITPASSEGAVTACAKNNLSTAPLIISYAIIARKTTIVSPLIASALPCPNGCSSSAGLFANLKPIYAIIEVATSENVCAPSATSA